MFRWLRTHKRWSGVLAFFLIATTSALAAWIVTSTGPGKGRTAGALIQPTVTAGAPTGTPLYPGSSGDLVFHLNNTSAIPVVVTKFEPMDGTDPVGLNANCPKANLSYPSKTGLSIPVPVGESEVTVPNSISMSANAPVECANQTFTINTRLTFSTP